MIVRRTSLQGPRTPSLDPLDCNINNFHIELGREKGKTKWYYEKIEKTMTEQ